MRVVVLIAIASAGCGRIAFDPLEDEVPLDAQDPVPLADAPPGALWLVPVADTYCRGGTYAGMNFGTEPGLVIKFSTGASFLREAFVKFDLAPVTARRRSSSTSRPRRRPRSPVIACCR